MGETPGAEKEPAKTKNRNMWKLYGTFQFDVRVSLNQTHFSFCFFAAAVRDCFFFFHAVWKKQVEYKTKINYKIIEIIMIR